MNKACLNFICVNMQRAPAVLSNHRVINYQYIVSVLRYKCTDEFYVIYTQIEATKQEGNMNNGWMSLTSLLPKAIV